jgi:hypothetical protein
MPFMLSADNLGSANSRCSIAYSRPSARFRKEMKTRILIAFRTRPEAIKMVSVLALRNVPRLETLICVTGHAAKF